MTTETILQEADRIVANDRQDAYGHPFDDFSRTAKMWSAVLGVKVTPEQVGLCMICLKISRECNAPKRDNMVDAAGYAKTVDMVNTERKKRETVRFESGTQNKVPYVLGAGSLS